MYSSKLPVSVHLIHAPNHAGAVAFNTEVKYTVAV